MQGAILETLRAGSETRAGLAHRLSTSERTVEKALGRLRRKGHRILTTGSNTLGWVYELVEGERHEGDTA